MRRTRCPHTKRGGKVRSAEADLERAAIADRLAARSVVLAALNRIVENGGRLKAPDGAVIDKVTPQLADQILDAMMDGLQVDALDAARCFTEEARQ